MIHTFSDKKHINGEREGKMTSLHIIKCRKQELAAERNYFSNLTENHMLFLIISGSVIFKDRLIDKGNFICISRFSSFRFKTPKSAGIIEITFDYSDNIELFNEPSRIFAAPSDLQDYTNKIFFHSYFYNSLPGTREGLLLNIINTLNRLCTSYYGEVDMYQKFCEWVEQNAKSYVRPGDAACAMNCSVAHLNRVVTKNSGRCASEIINERVIFEIKQLCKHTHLTTAEISARMGFDSPELLRKFFKYHTRISLKEYKSRLF